MASSSALDRLRLAVPSTSTIFHYTSQAGLLGIVNCKALWVSDLRFLNDSTEFAYAVELVREKLTRKLAAGTRPLNGYYAKILGRLDALKEVPVFVGSFSEEADLLSQWRAYTDNGVGFSVGFEYDYLKKLAEDQEFRIVKCVYEDAEHAAIVEELIALAGTVVTGSDDEKAVETFFAALYFLAPALKHPSFSEEKEWRLVSSPGSYLTLIKFRPGKSMLIPYCEFALAAAHKPMSISKIVVGPTPHKERSRISLQHLLTTSSNVCNSGFTIAPSRVPYRNW